MPSVIKRVRILLSSPGNLEVDRQVIREVVDTINRDTGRRSGFFAEVVGWDTHTRPAAGDYAQGVVNDQFPKDIDIFVGIMGSYFGRPTKDYQSGTEEEFYVAHSSWTKNQTPEIMFYFSNQASSLSGIDPAQWKLVTDFKQKIGDLGIYYFQYATELALRLDLHPQLSDAIHESLARNQNDKTETGQHDNSLQLLSNYEALLASDPLVAASELFETGSNALNSHSELQNQFTRLVVKLKRKIEKTIRTLHSDRNQRQKDKAIAELASEMRTYQSEIRKLIVKKQRAIIEGMTSVQRAVSLIKDNELEEKMPIGGLDQTVEGIIPQFAGLREAILDSAKGLADWPDDMGDISNQKKIIIAIHEDLDRYYGSLIELFERFVKKLRE
jgi:hypothetical protein